MPICIMCAPEMPQPSSLVWAAGEGLTRLQYCMIGFLNRISGRTITYYFGALTSINLQTGKLCIERCTHDVLHK